jgi:hypothetical protein
MCHQLGIHIKPSSGFESTREVISSRPLFWVFQKKVGHATVHSLICPQFKYFNNYYHPWNGHILIPLLTSRFDKFDA